MTSADLRHFNQVQLARRWALSPRTLERWRWLKQGPPFLKVGGRVLYRLQDVEAFEATQLHRCVSSDKNKPEAVGAASGHDRIQQLQSIAVARDPRKDQQQ